MWARMRADLTQGLTLELKDKKEPVRGCLVAERPGGKNQGKAPEWGTSPPSLINDRGLI